MGEFEIFQEWSAYIYAPANHDHLLLEHLERNLRA